MFRINKGFITIALMLMIFTLKVEASEKRQIAQISDIVTKEDINRFVKVKTNEILNEKNKKNKIKFYKELYMISQSEFERYNKELAILYNRLDEEKLDKEERKKILDEIYGISDFSGMWGDLSVAFEYTEDILQKKEGVCSLGYKSEFIRSYTRTEPDGSELNPAAQIVIKLAEDFCGGISN